MFTVHNILILAVLLRIGFFLFGLYQDVYMTVRYTDIDYLVFSDAARYVFNGGSPYQRETYRYTPLLAWMLLPNSWGGHWYHFGKILFMACDLVTGFFIIRLLQRVLVHGKPLSDRKVVVLSSLWLLNPIVITISTRGSSESVLTVMVMASLYYLVCKQSILWSGIFLGLATHFKMYPLIYIPSIMLYLSSRGAIIDLPVIRWVNFTNIKFFIITVLTFGLTSYVMYQSYGQEFLEHSYLYHFGRIDHRHNFSVYNIALYYKSAFPDIPPIQEYAFLPQIVLAILIPLVYARKDIISTLFLQTFAFVTFNKVVTSQYFIWFLIMLPHYLASSSSLGRWYKGPRMFLQWALTQGLWLKLAYELEFLGQNSFGRLLACSVVFYLSNCGILCEFIEDLENRL